MHVYEDFEENILKVKKMVIIELRQYKSPLRNLALSYIESRHLSLEHRPPRGITLYLPFWLAETFDLEQKIAEMLSLANLFVTLYIETKDGIIDNMIEDKRLFSLSDRFFLSYINILNQLMPAKSIFWAYFYKNLEETLLYCRGTKKDYCTRSIYGEK